MSERFTIFAKKLDNNELLFIMPFQTSEFWDLAPRWDDCVFGSGHYVGGDRIGYHTAYCFYAHQDPGHHAHLSTIRFMVQGYGPLERKVQINDRGMPELGEAGGGAVQGKPPYPYEKGVTVAVDERRPGGVIDIYHNRVTEYDQLIARYEIPAVSRENPKVRWYYQLGGLFVAVHDEHGPVARVIVASMHPAYAYRIQGVDIGGIAIAPQKDLDAIMAACGGPHGEAGDSVPPVVEHEHDA